jgi:hypothetical protein
MLQYLALRKTLPSGTIKKTISTLIKWRLHTNYPHAGIVEDGVLYEMTTRGLIKSKSLLDGWDLFPVVPKQSADNLYKKLLGIKYDYVSEIAFVLPIKIRDAKRMYCYEFCYRVMTGDNPSSKVTPELLLALRK